jgi:hypothetical protein
MCTCLLGHGLPTTKACPPSPTPAPASCQPTAVPREATGQCGLRAARSGSPLVSVSAALGTSNSSLCGTMGSSSAPSSAAYTGAISARYCSSSNIRQMSSSGTLLTSTGKGNYHLQVCEIECVRVTVYAREQMQGRWCVCESRHELVCVREQAGAAVCARAGTS